MWFKKKQTNQSNSEPSNARRKGDMRSELGLSGETHQAVRVRARQVQRDGLNETTAVYDEEVQLHDLKVRARRRLIGALVLLGAAFVILPWVFDGQRKETAAQVAVSIPDKNVQFDVKNPKATDESLRAAAESADKTAADGKATDAKPSDNKAAAATTATTTAATTAAPAKPADTKQAVPATPTTPTTQPTQQYAVHIGLVSDKKELDSLVARLRAAGVQPQLRTVTVDGASKTRVRLGLFKTQTEAEAALAKVKGVAKNPVVIPIQQEQTKPKP
ncbi:MAG: SPOR domain-containing protein [Burkholderiaceae bacterium]|jgi:DedD protein